ncbi:MAG: hypothetical protein J6M24_02625 [Lachnospiraceae bacterium]|nr:hypothetical protein [Lachnospiraceae bacterium]
MSLITSDFIQLIKKEKIFLIQILLLHMIAIYFIMFIFDAMLNNYMVSQESEDGTLKYNFDLYENDVYFDEIEDAFFELYSGKYGKLVKQITVSDISSGEAIVLVFSAFKIKDGKYDFGITFDKIISSQILQGRNFTADEFDSDEKKTISMYFEGDTFVYENEEYSVIGKRAVNQGGYEDSEGAVPLNVFVIPPRCFKGHIISDCALSTARILTAKEKNEIRKIFEKKIPGRFDFQFQSEDSKEKLSVIKTSFIAGGLIVFSVIGALIIIYVYNFSKRRKKFAIWRLTGLSKKKTISIIVVELSVLSGVGLLTGMLVFAVNCNGFIGKLYKYTETVMTAKVDMCFLFGLFLLVMMMNVMISVYVTRVSVREMLNDKRG